MQALLSGFRKHPESGILNFNLQWGLAAFETHSLRLDSNKMDLAQHPYLAPEF
jgi:hypothetical protein